MQARSSPVVDKKPTRTLGNDGNWVETQRRTGEGRRLRLREEEKGEVARWGGETREGPSLWKEGREGYFTGERVQKTRKNGVTLSREERQGWELERDEKRKTFVP